MKQRVVVIGSAGFVGSNIIKSLDPTRYEPVAVSRKECDLAREECISVLEGLVQDGDIVVCAAAKAPAKNLDMLTENVSLITHIVQALKSKYLAYVLNISSDAVYADSMDKITETSLTAPLSAHGIMHCMREFILEKTLSSPVGHLRPTLIYGEDDPHNGYGPNSFLRTAVTTGRIELFGNGEEQRDHIFVGDVAKIALGMIAQRVPGAVNAVTGTTMSFMEIAACIRDAASSPVEIVTKPRSGPMPHNGYRAFANVGALRVGKGLPFMTLPGYIQSRMPGRATA